LSPTHHEQLAIGWEYVATRTSYRLKGVSYQRYTCEVPKAGAVSVEVDVYAKSATVPDSFASTGTPNEQSSRSVLGKALNFVMKPEFKPRESVHSGGFPYFVRASLPARKHGSHLLAYSRVNALADARYEIPQAKSPGELASEAVATLDSNSINMFEFLQGLKRPQDLVPKLKNLSKLKTHAGNYLGVQYGILPTVSDLETLKEAIMGSARPYYDVNNYRVLTAGHSAASQHDSYHVSVTNRIKLAINDMDPALFTLSERLRDIGGFPSINNLWELVPYSFVIDWFINVGDMLEAIDTRFRMSTLPIIYATSSSKIIIEPDADEALLNVGAYGTVKIVLYDRNVSESAPTPPLTFEASNELPNHWLEAGALIVTARK
jgi:hypothetical protein